MSWKDTLGTVSEIAVPNSAIGELMALTLARHKRALERVLPRGVQMAFVVTGTKREEWVLDFGRPICLRSGRSAWPDCLIECSEAYLIDLFSGQGDMRAAFVSGQIGVQGDVGLLFAIELAFCALPMSTPASV